MAYVAPHLTSDRETFDFVRNHLLTQKCRSMVMDGDMCAYRGQHQAKCAVGCLISDEHYDSDLEGLSVVDNFIELAVRESTGFLPSYGILLNLQRIHDSWPLEEWEDQLDQLSSTV